MIVIAGRLSLLGFVFKPVSWLAGDGRLRQTFSLRIHLVERQSLSCISPFTIISYLRSLEASLSTRASRSIACPPVFSLDRNKPVTYPYRMDLPNTMKIHNVIHVSLFDLAANYPLEGLIPPPPPVEVEGEEQWQVQEVLDSKFFRNRLRYLVKWEGYDETTWELAESINELKGVDEFHERYSLKPGPLPENPE